MRTARPYPYSCDKVRQAAGLFILRAPNTTADLPFEWDGWPRSFGPGVVDSMTLDSEVTSTCRPLLFIAYPTSKDMAYRARPGWLVTGATANHRLPHLQRRWATRQFLRSLTVAALMRCKQHD